MGSSLQLAAAAGDAHTHASTCAKPVGVLQSPEVLQQNTKLA
jgi:hypothetical protein